MIGIVLCIVCCMNALPGPGGAQLIDRMLAVVDGQIVTEGDIEDFRLLGAFFDDTVPEEDGAILDQIIENILIGRQIAEAARTPVSDADVDTYLAQFGDPGELPSDVVREEARARIARARYFDSIRRSMRATPQEIQDRYDNEFVPALRARGVDVIPPLFEVEDQLDEIVRTDKLNAEIASRVADLYRRYQVEVVD